MKRLLIASLIALSATAANAQGMTQETCQTPELNVFRNPTPENEQERLKVLEGYSNITDIERKDALQKLSSLNDCKVIEARLNEVGALFDQSWTEIESKREREALDNANNDLINGARARWQTGNPADVIAGLEALRNHVKSGEGTLTQAGLNECPGTAVGSMSSQRKPCNPFPALKRLLDRDFNQKGWSVQPSATAAFDWLIDQYKNGSESTKKDVLNYADSVSWNVAEMRIMPAVYTVNVAATRAESVAARRQEIAEERAQNATIIGNFTSIHQRILPAIGNWFGMLVAVILLAGFAVSPWANWFLFFLPHESRIRLRDKLIGSVNHIMIAFIPVQAIYVVFGGILDQLMRGHGWLSKLVFLALFVPLVVLVRRTWPNATIIPPALFRFFKSSGSKSATNNIAADGLHGSASWSDAAVAVKQGRVLPNGRVLSDSYGFALGRIDDPEAAKYDLDTRLRYMGHVLTVAPSGSGKGVGAVAPTLLEYPGSTIALDPKGELYAVTHRARNELGHKVVVIDPFGALAQLGYDVTPARLNWLDYIDPDSPDVVTQSALLADLIVVAEGRTSDNSAHFNETAKAFLRGLIVHVATLPADQRKMGELRKLLTTDSEQFDELLADMMTNDRGHGLPARAANSLLATPEKERGSILSTVRRHTDFLDDPRIAEALSVSDFDLNKLKQERMTVYVVMPPDRIELNKRFLRVMFGLAVQGVTTVPGKPEYRVLFMLDEFAQLGHMTVIEKALPIIRGFGGVFWFILQNIGQLKSNYQEGWQSFVANSGAKQFFGTSDFETAKFISETLGKTTVEYQTSNNNSGSSFGQGMSTNSGAGVSQQFTARDLLTPDEVLKLPAQKVVVMTSGKGEAPYLLDRITYYVDSAYEGRFDPNPFEG